MIRVKSVLRKVLSDADKKVLIRILGRGIGAQIYYIFLSRAFNNEHKTALAGRVQYEKNLGQIAVSSPLLRRNIHRIEKGLTMRPRRKSFARDYIVETVAAYKKNFERSCEDKNVPDELLWSHDVLREYFSVVEDDRKIAYAREQFESAPGLERDAEYVPFNYRNGSSNGVSYDALLELSRHRKSVRWFEQKRVPREVIDNAVSLAGNSPSACNRQAFVYHVFDDPAQAAAIASIPMGTQGYADNVPGVVVIVGDQSAYFHERDRHLIYIDASLSVMAFVFALEAQGISSCVVNWPDIPAMQKAMKERLDLKTYQQPVMLVVFGYPDPGAMVPYSKKKPLDQLRRYH